MPDPTDPRAVAENVWLGYDPDCPECKGTGQLDSGGTYPWGERIMLACDCDAPPRAEADDPSGIVQQMTEGGGGLAPCPFCGGTASVYGPVGWYRQYGITHSCRVFYGGSGDFTLGAKTKEQAITDWNRRATEADLRAEVERLRAQAKGMTALLRAGCDLLAIESEALRNSISIIGDPDRLSDDPEDAPTIEAINEIEDWIASVKATLFPPDPSPETDGGHDGQ